MNFVQILQTHETLVWVLFLVPVFLTMHRGLVLDRRAERYGENYSYGPLLTLGLVPLVNIPVALYLTWLSIKEFRSYGQLRDSLE